MNKAVAGLTVTGFAIAIFRLLQAEPSNEALLAPELSADNTVLSQQPDSTRSDRESPSCVIVAPVNKSAKIDSTDRLPMTQERRKQVRQLIRQLRPQQAESAVEVWVEEFGHMSDQEISFLIQQSGLPDVVVGTGTQSFVGAAELTREVQIELPGPALSLYSGNPRFKDHRVDTARLNLQNTMTIGYRDCLALNVLSAGDSADSQRFSLRRLTVGEVIETWDPLHVALRTPGPVFFQLADGRLTRNGMFARMHHGQLGLRAGDGFVALKDSPVLPTDLPCEITADGRVIGADISNQIGRIRVVTVERADRLTTKDGVYFHSDAKVQLAEHFELQPGALELSNVDVEMNRHTLILSSGFFHGASVPIPEVGSVD